MNSRTETSQKSITRKAFHLVRQKRKHGVSKQQLKDQNIEGITSIGTERNYRPHVETYLQWRRSLGLSLDGPHLPEHMQEFMDELSEIGRDQRYLNSTKQALQMAFSLQLQTVKSEAPIILKSRAYEKDELDKIIAFQSEENAFTSRLCWEGGLRAHESLTLQRSCDLAPSSHRPWDPRRFAFMQGVVIYTVCGKGGLKRNVAFSAELAKELELRRLPSPIVRRSRGINHRSHYAVGGGASFSQSFSEASRKALGYSRGAHGLRHSYAQRRLQELTSGGMDSLTAMLILSQELGHFRPDIVLAYLR